MDFNYDFLFTYVHLKTKSLISRVFVMRASLRAARMPNFPGVTQFSTHPDLFAFGFGLYSGRTAGAFVSRRSPWLMHISNRISRHFYLLKCVIPYKAL